MATLFWKRLREVRLQKIQYLIMTEYTRQFLTNLYGMQYYGLPYKNVANQESSNQYVGKPEALNRFVCFTYPSCGISGPYYKGTHTANYGKRSDKFDYLRNNVWEAVRGVWMLIENIDNVPGLGEDEKASMVAQAKMYSCFPLF